MTVDLGRLEAVIDASGVAEGIEARLPYGVRPRQLRVRTLLLGVLLSQEPGAPAHLTRVHQALVGLVEADRRRLGVVCDWRSGPHLLSYRQTEYSFSRVCATLAKDRPDGSPAAELVDVVNALVEASVEPPHKDGSSSLAVDWTDVESHSSRRTKPDGHYADPEADWGHRKGGGPGEKDELFLGYYLSLATMVPDVGAAPVPELVRRMHLASCRFDPVPPMTDVLATMSVVTPLGDVVVDSGYSHRVPAHFALPIRAAGGSLVMDLHPHDRGPQGTHAGGISCNGNLYCPKTPTDLLELGPLSRGATQDQRDAHDRQAEELDRYRLGRVNADDVDGHHRVMCPAQMGKLRCPLRTASMALSLDRPEVLAPPDQPPKCCTQLTVTVPATVNTKTAQRHPYPSAAWRRSYARRSAVERSNSRIKDPATVNVAVADAFEERQGEHERRAAAGLPGKTRRRRRTTLSELAAASP